MVLPSALALSMKLILLCHAAVTVRRGPPVPCFREVAVGARGWGHARVRLWPTGVKTVCFESTNVHLVKPLMPTYISDHKKPQNLRCFSHLLRSNAHKAQHT